ncbi:leucine-rich repeat domain-containing protein [Clostridium perfringens]|uniref:Leucine-rich cell surface protein n=1 Tax=Clostridium perfringens TaxID=1502 RepID=A0A140GRJ4_CLOPF|nr:leucine-rich repeat domain-containing protein [Clostridium perfringens]AMN31153.1 leucine-rich cell surface protein [Clostridium perfringens]
MKKYEIQSILHSKGYVSIETLIVTGLIIATGAFLISKLVLKGKDVANSSNNNIINASKIMNDTEDDNYSKNQIASSENITYPLANTPTNIKKFRYENVNYKGEDGVKITGYTENSNDVVIPSCINGKKVIGIDEQVFHCKNITSVIIPDGVKFIGDFAFSENQLTSLKIPNSVTDIGKYVFRKNKLTSVTIPDNITYISEEAFSENQLTSVTIPANVTQIDNWAFYENKLTSITIHDNITQIGNNAFSYNKLTSLKIPNSVTYIGEDAFSYNKLTSVTMPKIFENNERKYFHHLSNITFNLI